MFKQSKEPEKKGSEKREDLLVSFLKDAHFVFAIIRNDRACVSPLGSVPQNAWSDEKEIPLVLRRYTGIDYPVFGNVADRNGQTAGAG